MPLLSLEGNIGSGKSTLLKKLRETYPEWIFLDEPVNEWTGVKNPETGQNIIECFYSDQEKYAFSFQILAYITRLKKLLVLKDQRLDSSTPPPVIVTERSIDTDHYVFAKMLYDDGKISPIDWQIYQQYIYTFSKECQVDAVVYVETPPETCLERIKIRDREGESSITLDYLSSCHRYHQDWLNSTTNQYPIYHLNASPSLTDESYWVVQLEKINHFITTTTPSSTESPTQIFLPPHPSSQKHI